MGIKRVIFTQKRSDCVGCGTCAQIDSKKFSMNKEDGKADLLGSKRKGEYSLLELDEFEKEKAKKCSKSCPVGIIRLEE
ncbi:MAG: ferredoxin [Candidatus Moraniibacteriota bacterium]|nr:MAG: ferredoxin [Candidatus Moranbacteria bacterium]